MSKVKQLTLNYLRDKFETFKTLTDEQLENLWIKYSNRFDASWISVDSVTSDKFHSWVLKTHPKLNESFST